MHSVASLVHLLSLRKRSPKGMIIRIIFFEWTKLASESRDMDQTCVFEENYSGFHGIRSVFRRKTQWTKLATECICRHMTEEVVDQTWDPRVLRKSCNIRHVGIHVSCHLSCINDSWEQIPSKNAFQRCFHWAIKFRGVLFGL